MYCQRSLLQLAPKGLKQWRHMSSKAVVRNDWTKQEIQEIYDMPFLDLIHKAATTHRQFFNPKEVQQCTLLSIKTGGCVEDCKYCSQSAKHSTFVKPTPTMKVLEVVEMAATLLLPYL